jgi:hypothetical protein
MWSGAALTRCDIYCKKQGWRIADAQEGEDIDLDEEPE